jgi:tol-pal system protein YbgF
MKRRSSHATQAALLTVLALSTSGCFWFTTKKEGRQLRQDVDKMQSSLPKLQRVLDEATKLLTRNSADLGAEVGSIGEEQKKLTGLVMEASRYAEEVRGASARQEQRIADLEKRITELESKAEISNKSAPQLWEEGMAALQARQYEQARASFRSLLVKYPGHERADDAQLQRGESYFRERKFQESLGEFQRVFEKYPDSQIADDAAYRAGEAAEELKWCTDARAYYGLLMKKYPRSELARKAKARDAALKKSTDNKKKCQS